MSRKTSFEVPKGISILQAQQLLTLINTIQSSPLGESLRAARKKAGERHLRTVRTLLDPKDAHFAIYANGFLDGLEESDFLPAAAVALSENIRDVSSRDPIREEE